MAGDIQACDTNRCIKCGFCMSVCPVYGIDRLESHVARGRNVLIRQAAAGQKIPEQDYREALSICLLCRRCETVCPARAPSTAINLRARKELLDGGGLTLSQRMIQRLILRSRPTTVKMFGLAATLPGMVAKGAKPFRHLIDLALVMTGEISIPRLSTAALSNRIPYRTLPDGDSPRKGKVAFFSGCNYEFFFPRVGEDVVGALAESGYEVFFPSQQTCCGMAVYNSGEHTTARRLAELNIRALSGFDHVITACATCGTALKAYAEWFPDDDPLALQAQRLSQGVSDFSEFIVGEGMHPLVAPEGLSRVTYHDPCHLKFHQNVHEPPRAILKSIQGLTFLEMGLADKCCGQGGAFGVKHPEVSLALLEKKMASVRETGAQAIVTSCPGCMVQLMDGVRRYKVPVEVLHISGLVRNRRTPPKTSRESLSRGVGLAQG
jgi:glycolate oxidase iron-sulfur subunit